MANPFGIKPLTSYGSMYGSKPKKKRASYSASVKMRLWQNLSHVCHICHKRITDFDAAELDHVRAYSKGGSNMRWAHRSCNRIKSSKSLSEARKTLGVKSTKRKVKRRKKHVKASNPYGLDLSASLRQPKFKWGI